MVQYNDRIVGRFLQATLIWGVLALLIGLYAALELQLWPANGHQAFLSFGRLKPLHADLMLLAFGANACFAGIYYALQRLCQVRVWSDRLAQVHFWGWQALLLGILVTLLLGFSQGRPLAEMEWPLDLILLILWGLFSGNVLMTLKHRGTDYLYISIWFFLASLVSFVLLHGLNALVWPAGFLHSYPVYVGLSDAMMQAFYAQNVGNFLLTLPCLGLMYYFVPKAAQKPVHSHRLAVVQFWSLIFLSVWTGPRLLIATSLAEWTQSLGLVFSLLLLAPSWGGAVNGLWTLDLRDSKLRRNPAVLFMALALMAYALAALLEALASFKSIHLVLQYSDWMSATAHLSFMGWIASFIFGMAYLLVPKIWQQPLYSRSLGRLHFWISAAGLVTLVLALGVAGLIEGLQWFAVQDNGLLVHPEFMTTLLAVQPFYKARMVGGSLFLIGAMIGAYNFYQTARRGKLQDETRPPMETVAPPLRERWEMWQRHVPVLMGGIAVCLLIGTLVELLPLPNQETDLKPYSPLVQVGRDLYVREGCAGCHTQVVRMALKEELRYGYASQVWEYQQDRPALWGMKRNGPDLLRMGGRYPHFWHYQHLMNPRLTNPGSLMPAYPWLAQNKVNLDHLADQQKALQQLGVALPPDDPRALYEAEAKKIQESLAQAQVTVDADAEIIALIAYLQKLGVNGKP